MSKFKDDEDKDTCSLLLENRNREVLMQLRDNKAGIDFPNTLATFGGGIEDGETPEQAMVREIYEELRYNLDDFEYLFARPYYGHIIHVFRKLDVSLDSEELAVFEGQKSVWVSKDNINKLPYTFAPGFKDLLLDYFEKHP